MGNVPYKISRRRPRMTVQEYLRTPETVLPPELIYGAMRVAEAPLPRHQRAVGQLFRVLDQHVASHGLGEVWLSPIDVILDEERHLVLQPDLLFISNERDFILMDRIRGAPDLTIEVLSPHPRIGDLNERLGWFAKYGVRECWVVELLSKQLSVHAFENGRTTRREVFAKTNPIRSEVLPDFHDTPGFILGF